MAIYHREKHWAEVKAVRDFSWTFSFEAIDKLQADAESLFAAEPPPLGFQKAIFPAKCQDNALRTLCRAINDLGQAAGHYPIPAAVDVPAEWSLPKSATYHDAPTLLYVHGGGFMYGSPGTARRATKRLADLTGGRCITPQYRKAPRHPFPAGLFDLFVVYLSLLAPPKSSSHEAIPAAKLVFAGESSGLNMLMALIQIILHLRKQGVSTVQFHDLEVELELPAAVAGMSGFFDITGSLPSWSQMAGYDMLPKVQPTYTSEWRPQALWPTSPPRADVYCEHSLMTHPLISPVTAASWLGAPPFFIAVGSGEMNQDSNLYLAKLAASQGVPVCLKQYEEMIHVWSTMLPKLPHSSHVMESWAEFMRNAAKGKPVQTRAHTISFDTLQAQPLDISKLTNITREEVLKRVAQAQKERFTLRRKTESKM